MIGEEIYLDRDLSRDFGVSYYNDDPAEVLETHGDNFRRRPGYPGRWDNRHRQIFSRIGGFKAEPGSGPGWWRIVEVYSYMRDPVR